MFHNQFDNPRSQHTLLLTQFMSGHSAREAHRNICRLKCWRRNVETGETDYVHDENGEKGISLEKVKEVFLKFSSGDLDFVEGSVYEESLEAEFNRKCAVISLVHKIEIHITPEKIQIRKVGDHGFVTTFTEIEGQKMTLVDSEEYATLKVEGKFFEVAAATFNNTMTHLERPLEYLKIDIEERMRGLVLQAYTGFMDLVRRGRFEIQHLHLMIPSKETRHLLDSLKHFMKCLNSQSIDEIRLGTNGKYAYESLEMLQEMDPWREAGLVDLSDPSLDTFIPRFGYNKLFDMRSLPVPFDADGATRVNDDFEYRKSVVRVKKEYKLEDIEQQMKSRWPKCLVSKRRNKYQYRLNQHYIVINTFHKSSVEVEIKEKRTDSPAYSPSPPPSLVSTPGGQFLDYDKDPSSEPGPSQPPQQAQPPPAKPDSPEPEPVETVAPKTTPNLAKKKKSKTPPTSSPAKKSQKSVSEPSTSGPSPTKQSPARKPPVPVQQRKASKSPAKEATQKKTPTKKSPIRSQNPGPSTSEPSTSGPSTGKSPARKPPVPVQQRRTSGPSKPSPSKSSSTEKEPTPKTTPKKTPSKSPARGSKDVSKKDQGPLKRSGSDKK